MLGENKLWRHRYAVSADVTAVLAGCRGKLDAIISLAMWLDPPKPSSATIGTVRGSRSNSDGDADSSKHIVKTQDIAIVSRHGEPYVDPYRPRFHEPW